MVVRSGEMKTNRAENKLSYNRISPADPTTFLVAALLLVSFAAAASYVPARRAAKVDPMMALRYL